MALELRPYQQEAIAATLAAAEAGVTRQLGVAATGLGKTCMFVALARQMGCRALILAHRDELVAQAADKVREWWPEATVGIVKASSNQVGADVVVASVQTLARSRRLNELMAPWKSHGLLSAAEPFGLVVVDEAHHATAATYRQILGALRAGEPAGPCPSCVEGVMPDDGRICEACDGQGAHPAGPLLLGVTATPDRGDGQGLNDLFEQIVWSYDVLWGIGEGYLCDLRGLRVSLSNLDLSGVKVRRGDYEAGAAGRALEDADAPSAIVAAWLRHAEGRRTLVFTPTVELARLTAVAYQGAGVTAAYVHGGTPLDERRRILADYSEGRVQVVANCAVLTEGFDEPRTDCVVMARPTKSRALYTQCVGRGTRRHPDKRDCLVLDVVGVTDQHSLVTIPSLFGLEDGDVAQRAGTGELAVSEAVHLQAARLVELGRISAREADLFRAVRAEGIAWVAVHKVGEAAHYERSLGDRWAPTVVMAVAKRGEHTGRWVAAVRTPDPSGHGTDSLRILAVADSMEHVQGVAEDYCRANGARHVVSADAPWRTKRPSPKALAAARKWRMTVDPSWNAGELSDALNAHIARRTGRRRAG